MGLVSRLYPTSIHLVSIFSPPSDVVVWAFLFSTLGRGLGRSGAEQHKGQACLCPCARTHSLWLLLKIWKVLTPLCADAETDRRTHLEISLILPSSCFCSFIENMSCVSVQIQRVLTAFPQLVMF